MKICLVFAYGKTRIKKPQRHREHKADAHKTFGFLGEHCVAAVDKKSAQSV